MVLKSEVLPGNYNSCKVWKGKSKTVIIHRWHYIEYAKEYKSLELISELNQLISYNKNHFVVIIITSFLFPYNSNK